jgi:hypothetical protein
MDVSGLIIVGLFIGGMIAATASPEVLHIARAENTCCGRYRIVAPCSITAGEAEKSPLNGSVLAGYRRVN